jgi:thioredoxin reductase (NADPH)
MMPLTFAVTKMAKKGDPNKTYDVIIIGSGPAGLTAAIYTRRFGMSTLVITGLDWGGQLMTTTKVENFPGFPEGIDGPDLMRRIKEQAINFDVEMVENYADEIDLSSSPFRVKVSDAWYKGKTLIIATGARYKELGLEAEKRLLGKGVSYCAVCDGYLFKDKKVAVVGGGDTALTDALYLSGICKEVHIIHRRDKFRASKALVEQVNKRNNIILNLNRIVVDIIGDKKVEGIKIKNVTSGETEILDIEGVFIAIGHIPNTDLVRDRLELTEDGYIKTYEFVKTSVPGVYVAGDVMDPKYQQAVTAAAFGAMAAIEAKEYLDSLG